jgi:hypothetical protein
MIRTHVRMFVIDIVNAIGTAPNHPAATTGDRISTVKKRIRR